MDKIEQMAQKITEETCTYENFLKKIKNWNNENDSEEIKKTFGKLHREYNKLDKNGFLIQQEIKRATRIDQVLSSNLNRNFFQSTQSDALSDKNAKIFYKLYKISEDLLSQLNLIKKVSFTFTYIDDEGNYYRATNLKDVNIKYYLESREEGKYVSLRLKEAAMRQKIKKKYNNDLNKHFQEFSEPYYLYQSNNSHGWRMNKGVVAEAFERHWEELTHSLDNLENGNPNHYGSEGHRWYLYRLSSGSDPYYTGPDTALSQVKNANASLLSDVNTCLRACEALFRIEAGLENGKIADEEARKIFNAFQQSGNPHKLTKKNEEKLQELKQDVLKELKEELRKNL